jgi:hypothetical protein
MIKMTDEQIEMEVANGMRNKNGFPYEVVKNLNENGVWLAFMNSGIRWSRKPFN